MTPRAHVRHACAGQPIVLVIAHGEDERTATLTPLRALQLAQDLLEAACRELEGGLNTTTRAMAQRP